MSTDADLFKRALAAGVAFRRRLSRCHDLVWIPDMGLAVVVLNPGTTPLFDFSKCKRLSRGAAHRAIHLMTDAPEQLKAFYHDLVDGKQGGAE